MFQQQQQIQPPANATTPIQCSTLANYIERIGAGGGDDEMNIHSLQQYSNQNNLSLNPNAMDFFPNQQQQQQQYI